MKSILITIPFLMLLLSCNSGKVQPTTEEVQEKVETLIEKATYNNLNVAAFASAIAEDENAILVDVRTPEETALGKIDGAIEIDFRAPDFEEKATALDKSKSIYLYCRSGGRSSNAAELLANKGFSNVTNLLGGFNAWSEANQ